MPKRCNNDSPLLLGLWADFVSVCPASRLLIEKRWNCRRRHTLLLRPATTSFISTQCAETKRSGYVYLDFGEFKKDWGGAVRMVRGIYPSRSTREFGERRKLPSRVRGRVLAENVLQPPDFEIWPLVIDF